MSRKIYFKLSACTFEPCKNTCIFVGLTYNLRQLAEQQDPLKSIHNKYGADIYSLSHI